MSEPRITRPKIQDHIIPQHQIERGDDELAFLLRDRHKDSSVDEITYAYFISNYWCPMKDENEFSPCLYPHNTEFPTFKDAFYHFRHDHYDEMMQLTHESTEEFRILAEFYYNQELKAKDKEVEYERSRQIEDNDWLKRAIGDRQIFLNQKSNYIGLRIASLTRKIEKRKEVYNRVYAMYQYFITIEANWETVRVKGVSRQDIRKRREKKYTAFYKLGREFLFLESQIAMMFNIPVSRAREYLYYGLDMYYGGEQNYPDWMKRVLSTNNK